MAKKSAKRKSGAATGKSIRRVKQVSRGTKAMRDASAHEDGDVDGCSIEFLDNEATADADLPPARGGVETA